jgi:hypothetical protein
MKTKLITAITLIAAAAPAFADYRAPVDPIDARQYQLEQRIEQGRASGALTPQEYGRLRREMRQIARDEQAYRADGRFSQREWQYLNARLDTLSRDVYAETRDGDRRGPYAGAPHYNDYRADRRY